ncbi:MAG TPA: hypothetical protein VGZ73_03020 [Bryobacteraceae bacterium]|jgi:hypothetical protein|nr:hypothetical protein [Bryobacteraceae bacterium]
MGPENELVRRIVSQAGIPSARVRRDLERELNAHIEDAAEAARTEGTGGGRSPICDSFGDPNEIALQFKRLHRSERIASFALDTFLLMTVSVAAVGALIASLQVVAALSLGLDPTAPRRLAQQIASIITLVSGYMGTYLGYRIFRRRRILKVVALDSTLCVLLTALCLFLPHLDPKAPLLTLAIGAGVRALQVSRVRRFWPLAAVVPVIAACLFSRRVVSAGNEVPLWVAAMIRCAGLTAACHALAWLSRTHQARRPA